MYEKILTPQKRADFLAKLSETANVTIAARHVGVSRKRMYDIYKNEPDFKELWDAALAEAVDVLVDMAHKRAFQGTTKPVFHRGEVCGEIREYSDTLTIFLLKAHDPEKFRDNHKLELSGPNNGPVEISDTDTAARLAKLMVAAQARRDSEEGIS